MKTHVLTILFLFAVISVHGQENTVYLPDTIWLKSGESIPCKIASINTDDNLITLKYYSENEMLTYAPMPFDTVQTYVIGHEIDPLPSFVEEILPPPYDSLKSIKAYLGFGGGYPRNAGLSFTVILKNDWGGSLSFKFTNFDKVDHSGETGGIFGPGTIPGDEFREYSICVLREFPSKKTKRIRFGLEFGPSLVFYEKVESYHITPAWIFGSYYTSQTSDHTTGGLALRAKLEFPVSQGFGFEMALYGNINTYKPHVGVEFYLTVGKVRDRLVPKK